MFRQLRKSLLLACDKSLGWLKLSNLFGFWQWSFARKGL
jgi:hypothetical protein